MSTPRLSGALVASAAVHLAALATVLALATHPAARPPPPAMRVALVSGAPSRAPGAAGRAQESDPSAGGAAPVARAAAARPSPRKVSTAEPLHPAEGSSGSPAALAVTPVQEDLWVLGAPPGNTARPGGAEVPSPPSGVAAAGAAGAGTGGLRGVGEGGVGGSSGAGASSTASLLETLQRRLAWSAARCAPASAVRLARHGVPGVPLHFCLDRSGTPSGVGLLGTTGSDQLDRAARDCVVPGALPLPPAQGCYTVEVRFPVRG